MRVAEVCRWIMEMTLGHQSAVDVCFYADACWVRPSAQAFLTLQDAQYAGVKLSASCKQFVHDRS